MTAGIAMSAERHGAEGSELRCSVSMVRIISLILSFPARQRRDRESSTAEDSQNWHRCRRTGSPGRGFASPEDDSLGKRLESLRVQIGPAAWTPAVAVGRDLFEAGLNEAAVRVADYGHSITAAW